MNRTRIVGVVVVGLVAFWSIAQDDVVSQAQGVQVPIFEYDPTFPKPLAENWAIGPIGGMAVDRQDHLFVVQRPGGLLTNGGSPDPTTHHQRPTAAFRHLPFSSSIRPASS